MADVKEYRFRRNTDNAIIAEGDDARELIQSIINSNAPDITDSDKLMLISSVAEKENGFKGFCQCGGNCHCHDEAPAPQEEEEYTPDANIYLNENINVIPAPGTVLRQVPTTITIYPKNVLIDIAENTIDRYTAYRMPCIVCGSFMHGLVIITNDITLNRIKNCVNSPFEFVLYTDGESPVVLKSPIALR